MEERKGDQIISNIGIIIPASNIPPEYRVVARIDNNNNNPNQISEGSSLPVPVSASQVISPEPVVSEAPGSTWISGLSTKKRRGRPRKYGPDGALLPSSSLSPTPMAIIPPSGSPPSVIDFSLGKKEKERARPVGSPIDTHTDTDDNLVSCSTGSNFTPHIISVNTGEDITLKIISLSQQGPRSICILSARGFVSTVTLSRPDSSGGTLTYEGRFELLSLTGTFTPCENGGIKNTSGGMSVSFANESGKVIGGGVAGILVADSPVQIVVGSFLAGNQNESSNNNN